MRSPFENLAQVALRFALEPAGVSTLIFGAHRPKTVTKNLKAAELPPLDAEVLNRIKSEYGGATEQANYF